VGRVVKSHGIKGEVVVEVRTDEPEERFAVGAELRGRKPREQTLHTYTVEAAREHSGRLLLRLRQVADRNAADALRGTLFVVDSSELPPSDDPDEFYDHELEGLTVRIVGRRKVGTVDDEQHPAQRVCGVATVDALQAQQKPPGVFPGGFHCVLVQVLVARLASTQNRADGEALLGFVGANLDDDFASDAVRLGHTAHDELHRRSPSGRCRRRRHGYPGHRFR